MAAIVLSTINAKWIHPSLALRLLQANLPPDLRRGPLQEQGGEDCVILEFALRQPLAEKTAAILAAAPGILALSVSVWNHEATLELLRALETAWAKAPDATGGDTPPVAVKPVIVLGGPEVTGLVDALGMNPQAAGESGPLGETSVQGDEPELFRYADFVISGEGEAVFAELCRAILEGAASMPLAATAAAKKRYGKYIRADPADPAAIESAYDLYTGEDLRQKLIYVEASRGCPFSCGFCQSAVKPKQKTPARSECQAAAVKPVREFPLEEFLARLEKLLQRGIKSGVENGIESGIDNSAIKNSVKNKKPEKITTVKFLDRSFNANIPRALRILEFCLEKTGAFTGGKPGGDTGGTRTENRFQFHFEMVPAIFPPELRSMLTRFPPGSIRLEIGIQSFNPQTCALIRRASDPKQELEALKFLRKETNAIVHADLIAGLPGEDIESFGRGFDQLWAALNGNAIHGGGADGGGAGSGGNAAPFEIQLGILKCLPGTPLHAMAESGGFAATYNKSPPYEVIETDCLSAADMEKIKNFARFWELIVNRHGGRASPFPGITPIFFTQRRGGAETQSKNEEGFQAALPTASEISIFAPFMELSQKLLDRFGRNYGIPKQELEEALISLLFIKEYS